MKNNSLIAFFEKLKDQNVKYDILNGKKKIFKYPKIKLPKGTNELGYLEKMPYPKELIENVKILVDKNSLEKIRKISRDLGFILHFRTSLSLVYFYYDISLGLYKLEILTSKKTKINVSPKSKFICFVSPEGGGKTSMLSAVYTALEKYPIGREVMTFSSFRQSRLHRVYDLEKKILKVYANKFSRKIMLSDRYMYLTFRNSPFLKKIINLISPEPDLVFVMKASYDVLKKRRGPLCSSKENVDSIYELFDKAKNKVIINSETPIEKNLEIVVNKITKLNEVK